MLALVSTQKIMTKLKGQILKKFFESLGRWPHCLKISVGDFCERKTCICFIKLLGFTSSTNTESHAQQYSLKCPLENGYAEHFVQKAGKKRFPFICGLLLNLSSGFSLLLSRVLLDKYQSLRALSDTADPAHHSTGGRQDSTVAHRGARGSEGSRDLAGQLRGGGVRWKPTLHTCTCATDALDFTYKTDLTIHH